MSSWGKKKKMVYVKLEEVSYFYNTKEIKKVQTYIELIFKHIRSYMNISWTDSNIPYQKIAKQRSRDENMWKKYEQKSKQII